MANDKVYTLEERAQGAEILKGKLEELGLKAVVKIRPDPSGDTSKDSAAVTVFDKEDLAVARVTINAKGYTNLANTFEDGDPKVLKLVCTSLDLKPSTYTTSKPQPGSFLKQALRNR